MITPMPVYTLSRHLTAVPKWFQRYFAIAISVMCHASTDGRTYYSAEDTDPISQLRSADGMAFRTGKDSRVDPKVDRGTSILLRPHLLRILLLPTAARSMQSLTGQNAARADSRSRT